MALLESRDWEIREILYFSDTQCSFLAIKKGKTSDMFFRTATGQKQQLHIKAINALARTQQAEDNQQQRAAQQQNPSTASSTRPTAARERAEWLRTVVPKLPAVLTPRDADKAKRVSEGQSGLTPDANRPRVE